MTYGVGFRALSFLSFSLALTGCLMESGQVTATSSAAIEEQCIAPAGVSTDPRSIYEAMTLINALPKPLSIVCFLKALDRPFLIQATSSKLSPQPAGGPESPRIFLIRGNLFMSVVPGNSAETELEFGELAGFGATVKGTVFFPILAAVPTSLPYTNVQSNGGTTCGSCHGGEVAVKDDATHTGAYRSNQLTPVPSLDVPVSSVVGFSRACDPLAEPQRCAILSAIVGAGDVSLGSF